MCIPNTTKCNKIAADCKQYVNKQLPKCKQTMNCKEIATQFTSIYN